MEGSGPPAAVSYYLSLAGLGASMGLCIAGRVVDDLRISNPPVSPYDEKAIRSYFFLCEDELEMRASGYISDNTYKIWTDGILE
jgi:hypothetical protein